MKQHTNAVAYYSVPQLGGGHSKRYEDGSLGTTYEKLPLEAKPCIRFDLSSDESVSAWRSKASQLWDSPKEIIALAIHTGCVVEG